MYVEPIYIESSNETSLPEVKQIIVAYEDHIVMETTLERAMESLFELMDPDAGTPPATDDGDPEELPEDEDSMPSIPLEGAEMILEQFSTLFDDYQEALSSGDWEEAGRIMAEIEEILATME